MFEFLPGANAEDVKPVKQKPIGQALAEKRQEREAAAKVKENTTVWDGIGATQVQGTIGTVHRFVEELGYEPVKGYTIPKDREQRWQEMGIPAEQWELFSRATSDDHLDWLEAKAIENTQANETLAQFGLMGNIALGMTDPGMFAIDAAAGPLSYGAKVGRLANAARSGAVAAATAGVTEAARSVYDPSVELEDMAQAAALSFAFGGALGARKGHEITSAEDVRPSVVQRLSRDENLSAAKVDGLANDPTPGVTPLRNETVEEQARVDQANTNAHLRPAFASIRRDLSARMGKSSSPLVREAGRMFFRDGVGHVSDDWQFKTENVVDAAGNITGTRKTRLVPFSEEWRKARQENMQTAVAESTTEFSKRHLATLEVSYRSGVNAAWADFRQANNVRRWDFAARAKFNEEVGRAVRGATDVSPQAKAAATAVADTMRKALRLQQESGLEAFDKVGPNANYLPRYWSGKGFQRLFGEMGLDENQVVEEVIKPAMRKEWEKNLPDRNEAKIPQIEEAYNGASTAARDAREKYDVAVSVAGDRRRALKEAEDHLAALPDTAKPSQRAKAEKRVRDAERNVFRGDEGITKAKERLEAALKSEDDSKFALNEARKVADLDVLDDDLLDAVARSYLKRAQSNFEGVDADLLVRPLDNDAVDEIEQMLKDANVSPERMGYLLQKLRGQAEDANTPARAKRRIDLDETFETTLRNEAGDEVVVRMSDLFDNDIEMVMGRYLREAVGWSAMSSKLNVKNRAQLEKYKQQLIADAKKSGDDIKDVERMLDIGINSTLGKSTEVDPGSKASRYGRFLRQWNFARVMNQVGFSLFAELGPVLAHSGVRNFADSVWESMPFLVRGADGKLTSKEARIVEELFAPGTDWMRNPPLMRLEDDSFVPPTFGDSKFGRAVDNSTQMASHITSVMSGMAPVNTMLQRIAGRATLLRLLDMANAKNLKPADVARLRNWGLSEKAQADLFAHLKGVKKIENIPVDKMAFQTKESMAAFLYRVTRHQVLEGDAADSLELMHGPVGKLLVQFRTFMVNSYTRHFLNSVHHYDDWRTYMMVTLSTAAAGMGWAARTWINTIGNDEQRQKQLTKENLIKNSVAQSSYSTYAPMVIDSVWGDVLQNDPVFKNNRSTGLSNGIMGIPTLDLVNKVYSGTSMIGAAVQDDKHITEKQMRDFWRIFWFNNMTGVRNIADQAFEPLPDKQLPSKNDE